MSTSARSRIHTAGVAILVAGWTLLSGVLPRTAHAQDESDSPFDSWARAIADAALPRWEGERVAWPTRTERPSLPRLAESLVFPVAVHGDPGAVGSAERVLEALEFADREFEALGWGGAVGDSGYGGSSSFDLYLIDGAALAESATDARISNDRADGSAESPPRPVGVGFDFPLGFLQLDTESTFAWLDLDRVAAESRFEGRDLLRACVVRAYAEGMVAAADPAEAVAWRRAIGAYLANSLTGSSCAGRALDFAQEHPENALISAAGYGGEAGAMLLEALAQRRSSGFVRELVIAARHWSWDGGDPHGEPDLWDAVFAISEFVGIAITRLIEDMAVQRGLEGAPLMSVLGLAPARRAADVDWTRLPAVPVAGELELDTLGSAYVTVDTHEANRGDVLRVWLRAELGVEWSLLAIRLGEDGVERGRMRAPLRPEPSSYLPIELDGSEARVLIVVMNQPRATPDADYPDERVRGFKLTVDRMRVSD